MTWGQTMARRTAFLLLLAGLLAAPALAHDYRLGSLTIDHPWARATAASARTGAVYLTVVNHGQAPDRLVGVETPAAERAELHSHQMDGGVMRMRPVQAIEVSPGDPAVLQPGGNHVMLVGLKAPLNAGTRFPLRLSFERAGNVEVEVQVESARTREPAPPAHGHGHGS